MSIAAPLLITSLTGLFAYSLRHAKRLEAQRQALLSRLGFIQTPPSAPLLRLENAFGPLVRPMFARRYAGFTVWFLEKREFKAPARPMLAVVFDHPNPSSAQASCVSPTHQALQDVWILPAASGAQEGLARQAADAVAKLAGYDHRLPPPKALEPRWWIHAAHATWQPCAPNDAFFAALATAPPLSLRMVSGVLLIEAQPAPNAHRTPSFNALLDEPVMEAVQRIAQAVLSP